MNDPDATAALATSLAEDRGGPVEILKSVLGVEIAPGSALFSPQFQDLVDIVNLAIQIHADGARRWFTTPEPELGGVLPATLLRDPANGRNLVRQALMNHLRGNFALGADGRALPKAPPLDACIPPAIERIPRKKRVKPRKKSPVKKIR